MGGNYIYNNEAIGAIAIASVMKHLKSSSIGKTMLFLPLLLHNPTTNFLKKRSTGVRSLEELLVKKGGYFINFDDRFRSLLPISLNSLLVLAEIGVINVDDGMVRYNTESKFDINTNIGNRITNIIMASEKLAMIMKEETGNLYLQLRVKL
ncbi:three component ABC system middle component [Tumebacillus sp. BK434]|uniref:three component ABC system middle component n=1 Tax=Tumebacillus sp. BK434 TaxID=2512169 RepID=UPI00104B98BC|nr:three component ABC system middle component [Tumebacillus sp. BK434]